MFGWCKNGSTLVLFCLLVASCGFAQSGAPVDFSIVHEIRVWSPALKTETALGNSGKAELLVLISPDCPMSRNYTLTLNKLQEQYKNEVRITGIIPGSAYTDEKVLAFAKEYQIVFPLVTDKKKQLVERLHGEVTPEVFLFDQTGLFIYHGAIDNWLVALGKKKQKPDQFYLADAIRQSLKGEPVITNYVKAQGCEINEY